MSALSGVICIYENMSVFSGVTSICIYDNMSALIGVICIYDNMSTLSRVACIYDKMSALGGVICIYDHISAMSALSELCFVGGYLVQADATAWMAFFCSIMLEISLTLSRRDCIYEDMASKFFEHFVAIADAINQKDGIVRLFTLHI